MREMLLLKAESRRKGKWKKNLNQSFVAIMNNAKCRAAVFVWYNKFPEGIKWKVFHVLKVSVFWNTQYDNSFLELSSQHWIYCWTITNKRWSLFSVFLFFNSFLLLLFCFWITMCNSFPPTGHDTITQLNDLGNSNYLFGMISLIRQQHQEKEDIGNNCFRLPGNKTKKFKCQVWIAQLCSFYSQGFFAEYVVLVSYSTSVIFVPCSVQWDFSPGISLNLWPLQLLIL